MFRLNYSLILITGLLWCGDIIANSDVERERLALIVEQLSFLEKEVMDIRQTVEEKSEIYLDYLGLKNDLFLVKSGIQAYIARDLDTARVIEPLSEQYIFQGH